MTSLSTWFFAQPRLTSPTRCPAASAGGPAATLLAGVDTIP